ncbi:MAG: SDR family oxidoreductase [Pseudomonadota bacterium]
MSLPRMPTMSLAGRRALVTGASRGIGLGAAVALAQAGAHVVLSARGAAGLDAAVAAMRQAGHAAEAAVCDVSDVAAVEAMVAARGPFDVLVNSAGTTRPGPVTETSEDDYDTVMAANTKAAFFLARAVAPGMAEKGGGSIIQISSQMGHVGGVDRALYCASKFAVEGMTKAMAMEWGPKGVRVNTICPTFIRTALTEVTFANPERVAWIESKIKLGRVGEVEDIMGPVLFLASDASALITGTHLIVDGGWTAG